MASFYYYVLFHALTEIRTMNTSICNSSIFKSKPVKQSQHRPGYALRVPGGSGSQISRQSAHEGRNVVSTMYRPPLPPPTKYSWYSFLSDSEWTPGPQWGRKGYANEKLIPMTQSGIEPTTCRLVAQCLSQLRYHVPQ